MKFRKMNLNSIAFATITFSLILGLNAPARAAWEGEEKPEFANAYTLRGGEWQIGLLRPTSVGLTDRLELSTSLLANAIGLVNAGLELNLWQGDRWALSISGAGLYSVNDELGGGQLAMTTTVVLAEYALLSLTVGHTWLSDARSDQTPLMDDIQQGINYVLEVEALFNAHNMTVFQLSNHYDLEAGQFGDQVAELYYAHAWDNFRIMAGVVVRLSGEWSLSQDDSVTTPVLPVVDFWWRF